MDKDFRMDHYRNIIDLLEKRPPPEPPYDFTERVMMTILNEPTGYWARVRRAARHAVSDIWATEKRFSVCGTDTEYCFYFLLTGFFYLIVGVALLAGLRGADVAMAAARWVKLQPYIALLFAFGFAFMGIILRMKGRQALRTAKAGIFLYIAVICADAVTFHFVFMDPYAELFILGIIGSSVLMGVFLAMAIRKMSRGVGLDGYAS